VKHKSVIGNAGTEQGCAEDEKKPMSRKIWPWVIFFACLLVLSLGQTHYIALADRALMPLRLALLAGLSLLVTRKWWRGRQHLAGMWEGRRTDAGDRFLQSARGWYYGEPKNPH
jgi:hypothetical protein